MGGQQEVSGPDLTQGVDVTSLSDGQMLLGHVGDEPVLVVRSGGEIFATGATCTHYGGPLADGLVVGDSIRCPWHHACFSLRNGDAVRPPAMNPIACWKVERDGSRVIVREKREQQKQTREEKGPASIVIVGGGAAGAVAVETLRYEGYRGPITMITADPSVPVDRPNLSKDYLAGNAPEEWIPLRAEEFYRENEIDLRLGRRVDSIDALARRVSLDDGTNMAFDKLLIATGADPVKLPLPGADRQHIYYLRTLGDSRAIIAAATTAKRALVMGASFIGLEVAASLRARGLEVTVVAPEERPLERVLGAQVGDFIKRLHEQHGVVFRLGKTGKAIESDHVVLSDGESIAADLVVIGVGVRPNIALAEGAGLDVDKGIVVNDELETSVPGIFAAGDVARYPDTRSGKAIRVEHWVHAQRMAQTAARNLLGRHEKFDAVPFFWSQHYDVVIAYVGHAESLDSIEIKGDLDAHDAAIAYRSGGRIAAFASIFRDRDSLEAEVAMERGDELALETIVQR